MVTRRQKITPKQGDLLAALERSVWDAPGPALDLEQELTGALCAAIRQSGLSRTQILDRMNQCLDRRASVTLRQLNAWTARSAETKRFPAQYLPAFCWATRSVEPLQVLLHPIDHEAVDRRDRLAAELGNELINQAQSQRRARELRQILGDLTR